MTDHTPSGLPQPQTVATQEDIARWIEGARAQGFGEGLECANKLAALKGSLSAPPDRYINVQNAWALLKAERTEEALAVLSKLIGADFMPTPQAASAQPVVADTLTQAAQDLLDTELGDLACTGSDAPVEDALGRLRDALASPPRAIPAEQAAPKAEPTLTFRVARNLCKVFAESDMTAAECVEALDKMAAEGLATPPAPTTEPTAKPITGLTEEEMYELADSDECNPDGGGWGPKFSFTAFAKAITRALAEKNGLAVQGGE